MAGKLQVALEVLQCANEMANHKKGHYLVLRVLDCLASCDNSPDSANVRSQYWAAFAQSFTSDMQTFASLAQNQFGSFVLKRFLTHQDREANTKLLARLQACGLTMSLSNHSCGKFVVRYLQRNIGE
jgi:hypothetical protein